MNELLVLIRGYESSSALYTEHFFSFRPSTLTACGRKSVGWGIVALYQADFVRIPSGIIDVIQYEIVMNRGLWFLRPVVPDNDFLIFFCLFLSGVLFFFRYCVRNECYL